jgi:hypothetical protein
MHFQHPWPPSAPSRALLHQAPGPSSPPSLAGSAHGSGNAGARREQLGPAEQRGEREGRWGGRSRGKGELGADGARRAPGRLTPAEEPRLRAEEGGRGLGNRGAVGV